jgi:hypothetical protein
VEQSIREYEEVWPLLFFLTSTQRNRASYIYYNLWLTSNWKSWAKDRVCLNCLHRSSSNVGSILLSLLLIQREVN